MNKLFTKITSLALGAAMMIGVGVSVGSKSKVSSAFAAEETIAFDDSDVSGQGTSGGGGDFTVTRSDVVCYFSNAYGASAHVKVYGKAYISFSAVSGKTVTFKRS